jgi:hypothetical protein
MNKKELQQARDLFKENSAFIRRSTIESIIGESEAAREKRIEHLLKPENYKEFFDYYLGKDTPIPMADSPCAWYHLETYKELYRKPFITQFRLVFRGGAKSIHSDVGNPLALKQSGILKFFLVIGANELRAKMLLADLQVQLESNQRIIKDFGSQISYGNWADGMFETSDRSYFMALGIEQPFRGLRHYANRIGMAVVDDVEDRKIALNPTLVEERGNKITGDLAGAFAKDSGRLVIANNHITKTGIVNYLLKKKGFEI